MGGLRAGEGEKGGSREEYDVGQSYLFVARLLPLSYFPLHDYYTTLPGATVYLCYVGSYMLSLSAPEHNV